MAFIYGIRHIYKIASHANITYQTRQHTYRKIQGRHLLRIKTKTPQRRMEVWGGHIGVQGEGIKGGLSYASMITNVIYIEY